MSATVGNTWTVNGKTKLNDRLDVTDETYVNTKKLKTIATSGDFADLINVPVLQGTIANPPDLTAATTAFATVTATSKTPAAGYDGYFAFNAGSATSRWIGGDGLYNTTTSVYSGTVSTTIGSTAVKGEYVQIQFPGSINPLSWIFSEYSGARAFTVVLAGSVDGTTFTQLSQNTNADKLKQVALAASTQSYSYFRVIFTACNNSTCLNDCKFFTAAVPVNANWTATTGAAAILNKPTIPAAQVSSDWNATVAPALILNKPTIPTAPTFKIQSGIAQIGTGGIVSVTFPVAFANLPQVVISPNRTDNPITAGTTNYWVGWVNVTTTAYFTMFGETSGGTANAGAKWNWIAFSATG